MVANFSLLLQLRLPKQKGRTIMVTNKAMHNLISIYICIERDVCVDQRISKNNIYGIPRAIASSRRFSS